MYIWSQKYSKHNCNLCACLKRYNQIFLIFDMFTNIYIYIYIFNVFEIFTNIYRLKIIYVYIFLLIFLFIELSEIQLCISREYINVIVHAMHDNILFLINIIY